MASGTTSILYPTGTGGKGTRQRNRLLRLYDRFTPIQGWSTFLLLMLALLVLGQSVSSAGWARTPSMLAVMFWGAALGLALAKLRIHAVFLHPIGLVVGFLIVMWRTGSITGGETLFEQQRMAFERLGVWYEAATTGGISTDLLPVSLTLLGAAWIISYVSSWFVFRSNNVWVGVVLMGTALLTNLSFLPASYSASFFLFAFIAILLIVRLSIVLQQQQWSRAGIGYEPSNGWMTINNTFVFGIVVLVVASLLPLHVFVSPTLAGMWRTARSPVSALEGEFARLFSAIPSRKDLPGRLFGDTLPFLGSISFGGEPVFWAETDYPSYWVSRTYSEYTPAGWVAGQTQPIEVGPQIVPPPRVDDLKREPVQQLLQLDFESRAFLSGGGLDWVSHGAILETLAPKKYTLDLLDPSTDEALPEDMRELAETLREDLEERPVTSVEESIISRNLPSDLVLEGVTYRHATIDTPRAVESVTVARKEPIAPEIVSWSFAEPLPSNHPYTMVSYVSVATDDDLRQAGADYHGFIRDHYLALPPDLPQRVRDLSERITVDAETPLDKAVTIQEFLRSDRFVYSQSIDAPPAGADGVDHFLFETQTGYSDYYASAMAVMLRSVGVPTRLAAGYAPGQYYSDTGMHVVRDLDSHGWVQVYFPGYGWIDFEPTPNWSRHERRLITDLRGVDLGTGREDAEAIDEALEDLFDDALEDFGVPPIDREGSGGLSIDVLGLLRPAAIVLAVIGAVWLVLWLAWTRNLSGATPAERAYTKMSRLGAIAGVRRDDNQTPLEYARSIGAAAPAIAEAARRIGWAFALRRYGGEVGDGEVEGEEDEIDGAWREMRLRLLGHAVTRLVPLRARA